MTITDENHLTFTPDVEYTQDDLIAFNPFAESSSSTRGRSTAFQLSPGSYQNGSNSSSRSTSHRRRASGGLVLEQNNSSFTKHARSRTEIDLKFGQTSSLHPLKSAGLRPDTGNTGITRPSLERLVKEGQLVDVPSEDEGKAEDGEEKKDVFVHQIRPGDSLAGVSLKYGIGLADLRRANHLWSSDSIHLRTVLYIPVEQATRLKKQPPKEKPEPEERTEPLDELDELDRISSPKTARPTVPEEVIQRVPASQLSYFPPPLSRSATQSPAPETGQPSSAVGSVRSSPYNPRGAGQTSSLTSLLTALPIAASTRDDIVSRLSFESTSSSYSGGESESAPEDLELDDVGQSRRRRRPDDVSIEDPDAANQDSFSMITPKVRQNMHRASEVTIVDPRSLTHARHLSISPPAYIPPHTQIRTQQLEPSPTMQLPFSKTGPTRNNRGTKKDALLVDVELHATNSTVS